MLLEILFVLFALGVSVWVWLSRSLNTFRDRNVPYEKPHPVFGNTQNFLTAEFSFIRTLHAFYQRNKHHKVAGYFNLRNPFFIVNDRELIKKICVKDFDHFRNHYPLFESKKDVLWMEMLLNMKDHKWRDMRNTLTPAFTANKMKNMFTLMDECFEANLKYLKELSKDSNGIDLDLKECFSRLSTDIIASTAFGLKINSFENPENEFFSIGKSISNFRGTMILKMTLFGFFPSLCNLIGMQLFNGEKTDYFMRLVCDAIKYRQEHNIFRPDMIQLLIEAKNESPGKWSDAELVAQCFTFFFAAFENNAHLIALSCYELMQNPDKQDLLFEEVQKIHKDLEGDPLTYDILNKMPYTDMVVSEVLRKWNFSIISNRWCCKDYKALDEEGNLICEFKKGDIIWIPLLPLSLDEDNFPDPHKFIPERFSQENKENIPAFSNMPFGAGPRVCIGSRYALMQGKAMLYHLTLNYRFERCEKSFKNLFDELRGFQLTPKEGIWVRFVPRSRT